ncbi:alkaline ceramidase 3-like isoform X1 [Branchiostoma floridae]|uniref:Alkaline ceramidase n=2 Tax=Branchiostoma floridae TaxID=7739 RepID=A0A9J7M1S9_BRAFL|nr:alkaline ceramidase 3-like isoform X1 [Branchiostoma floridae]
MIQSSNVFLIPFQAAYAVLVFTLFFKSVDMLRRPNSSRALFFTALATYGTGFIIWNIDNFFCHNIREFRGTLTSTFRPLTQLHAWWHLLAGLGTYIHVLYSVQVRTNYLKWPGKVKTIMGIPYYHVSKKVEKNGPVHKD